VTKLYATGLWGYLQQGHEIGIRPKRPYFIAIGLYSMKTVTNRLPIITSTGDKLHKDVNIDDLE